MDALQSVGIDTRRLESDEVRNAERAAHRGGDHRDGRQANPAARRRGTFAQVPLEWAAKAAKATNTLKALVWIELLYAVWQAKSEHGHAVDGAARGLPPDEVRALRELEAAGLVKVAWRDRKAPLVLIKRKPDA